MEPITFKKWSNRKYAVLASFHQVIRIGTLSFSLTILSVLPLLGQADTAVAIRTYTLEEVKATTEAESGIYSPILRELIQLNKTQSIQLSARSVTEILELSSGIDVRTRGTEGVQSDLSIRGGSFDQSIVLLNGINISDPQTGHFNLDLPILPDQLNNIEILKGPFLKNQGWQAYSGAINLITEPSDSLKAEGKISLGQFNTRNYSATINLPAGNTRHLLSAYTRQSDGYRKNTDYNQLGLYYHSSFKVFKIKADVFTGYTGKKFGANAFYTPRFPQQYEETTSLISGLKIKKQFKNTFVTGKLYWRRHFDYFLLDRNNPDFYQNNHLNDAAGSSISLIHSSKTGVTNVAVNYRFEQIYSNNLGITLPNEKSRGIFNKMGFTHYDHRHHLSLSAFHTIQLNKLYANGGFLIHSGVRGIIGPSINPGVDLSFRIRKRVRLFATINQSMRLPTFTDLYYTSPQNIGNPKLQPEKAITYESGAHYHGSAMKLRTSIFYRKGTQTIDWIWKDDIWQTMNLTRLNGYGGESSFSWQPTDKDGNALSIGFINFTYSRMFLKKFDQEYISNYALDNLAEKITLSSGINFPLGLKLEMSIMKQARNGAYLFYEEVTSNPLEIPYKPFWLFDLTAALSLNHLIFYIDTDNVFDISYRDIGSVPMPGRWITIGLKWNSLSN